jgi:hypothetical protein
MVNICTTSLILQKSTFVHKVYLCVFLWISEQTAIISLYNINLTGFYNWSRECLLRGTDWVFKCDWYSFVLKRLNKKYLVYFVVFFKDLLNGNSLSIKRSVLVTMVIIINPVHSIRWLDQTWKRTVRFSVETFRRVMKLRGLGKYEL